MQTSSSDACGASNPVCRIAELPLDAPSSTSTAFSSTTTRAPASAKALATAAPTTPAPITATSQEGWAPVATMKITVWF
jgi:hypothetical protein